MSFLSDAMHLLAFNIFKKPQLDFLKEAEQSVRVHIQPAPGATTKEMEKFLSKLFGKKMEYILTNLDGVYRIDSCDYPNSKEYLEYMISRPGWHHSHYLIGKGAKLAKKLKMKDGKERRGFFSVPGFQLAVESSGDLVDHFNRMVFSYAIDGYSKKSATPIQGVPSSCPGCKSVFNEEVEKEDEDGDTWTHVVELSSDGTCDDCGYQAVNMQKLNFPKLYKEIREFETDRGVQIFPKVA